MWWLDTECTSFTYPMTHLPAAAGACGLLVSAKVSPATSSQFANMFHTSLACRAQMSPWREINSKAKRCQTGNSCGLQFHQMSAFANLQLTWTGHPLDLLYTRSKVGPHKTELCEGQTRIGVLQLSWPKPPGSSLWGLEAYKEMAGCVLQLEPLLLMVLDDIPWENGSSKAKIVSCPRPGGGTVTPLLVWCDCRKSCSASPAYEAEMFLCEIFANHCLLWQNAPSFTPTFLFSQVWMIASS